MDILRSNMAPISDAAWNFINDQARMIFESTLTARKFVDLDGPKGWDYSAVPTGRLEIPGGQKKDELSYGINQVLPLVETRAPFELDIWELDNVVRGAEDIDLSGLEQAAHRISDFEDRTVFQGFPDASISGLVKASEHKAMPLPDNAEEFIGSVSAGINQMRKEAVEGPYTLVVNPELWQQISGHVRGYPLNNHLEQLTGGSVVISQNISETALVSNRGGDFRLTLGQDLSVGYKAHDSQKVQLFFTESFTFQVIDPKAVLFYK